MLVDYCLKLLQNLSARWQVFILPVTLDQWGSADLGWVVAQFHLALIFLQGQMGNPGMFSRGNGEAQDKPKAKLCTQDACCHFIGQRKSDGKGPGNKGAVMIWGH